MKTVIPKLKLGAIKNAMNDVSQWPKPKFPLGQILFTPGAIEAVRRNNASPWVLFGRHAQGDWGDLTDEDKHLNNQALLDGSRLLSAYHLKDGTKLWIITEADRSATTLLLPEEY